MFIIIKKSRITSKQPKLERSDMDIVISFEKYIPKPHDFYRKFEILKRHKFIKDIRIVTQEGQRPIIQIIRNNEEKAHSY